MFYFDFKLWPRFRNDGKPDFVDKRVVPDLNEQRIAVCAWACDEGPIKCFTVHDERQLANAAATSGFLKDAGDETCACALNAQFNAAVWDKYRSSLGIRPATLRCLITQARLMSLPFKLSKLAEIALDFEDGAPKSNLEKTVTVHDQSNTVLDDLKSQSVRDVDLCRQLWPKLSSIWQLSTCSTESTRAVWRQFTADMEVNRNGIPIEMGMARQAVSRLKILNHETNQTVSQSTENQITRHTQIAPGMDWILTKLPSTIPFPTSYKREEIDKIKNIVEQTSPNFVPFLEALANSNYLTGAQNWKNALDHECEGRIYNVFNYAASMSGRWTTAGLHFHSLPSRTKAEKPTDWRCATPRQLYASLRRMVAAPRGRRLIIADYKQFELRILLALAERHDVLENLHKGGDLYKELAREIYKTSEPTKEQRNVAKIAVLALNFGMGENRLFQDLRRSIGTVTEKESKWAYNAYHDKFPEVKQAWGLYENAWKSALDDQPAELNGLTVFKHPKVNAVVALLPSGRPLWYWILRKVKGSLEYKESQGSYPSAWGGKLVAHVCQAIGRDILADAIERMCVPGSLPEGARVIGHIHDEILVECPEENVDATKNEVEKIMEMETRTCQRISLPLKVETRKQRSWAA